MTSLDERFAKALHSSARGWRHVLDRHLKASGLTQAGWMAVAAAAAAESPLSQSELAQQLGVEGATMVAMVDRLVSAGMVRRTASDTDRRVKLIVVTDRGQELYARVKIEADALRKVLLKDIDRAHMQIAADVLEQLQQVLEAAS
jgi:MarR family transcriptional regulator for hemolysin